MREKIGSGDPEAARLITTEPGIGYRMEIAKGKYDGKTLYNNPEEMNVHIYRYQRPFYLWFLHDGKYTISIYYDNDDAVKERASRRDGQYEAPINVSGPTGL